jgi:hypothetical protein
VITDGRVSWWRDETGTGFRIGCSERLVDLSGYAVALGVLLAAAALLLYAAIRIGGSRPHG